jgi:hypothetical protein
MISDHSSTAKRFFDWALIRLSRNTRVDGLWVGVFMEERGEEILGRLVEAIRLIKTYDPYRYRRVLREVERVWAHLLPGVSATWLPVLRRCVVDPRFILSASPPFIASAIVHEATHGALMRRHIGYSEHMRERVEKVCMRQELAFASKIPDGGELRQHVEYGLSSVTSDWLSDAALTGRRAKGESEMGRYAKIPDWVVRAAVSFREKRARRRQ